MKGKLIFHYMPFCITKQKLNHRCLLFSLLRQIPQIEKKNKEPVWTNHIMTQLEQENFPGFCHHVKGPHLYTCAPHPVSSGFFKDITHWVTIFSRIINFFLSWIIPLNTQPFISPKTNLQNSPFDSISPCSPWLDLFIHLIFFYPFIWSL